MTTTASYCQTFTEYLGLLPKVRLAGDMVACEQADWELFFQEWSVVGSVASIGFTFLMLAIHVFLQFLTLQWVTMVFSAIFGIIWMLITLSIAHLQWFCVVKKKGC